MQQVTLTTTLDLLRKKGACHAGYRKLVKHLGTDYYPQDKPINLLTILESNGVQDMMWCLRATQQDCLKQLYLICADMVESVLPLFTAKYPNDDRPAKAIQSARAVAAYAAYAADAVADAAYEAADAVGTNERKKQVEIIRKYLA